MTWIVKSKEDLPIESGKFHQRTSTVSHSKSNFTKITFNCLHYPSVLLVWLLCNFHANVLPLFIKLRKFGQSAVKNKDAGKISDFVEFEERGDVENRN